MKKFFAVFTLLSVIALGGFAAAPKKKTAGKHAKAPAALVVKAGEEHSYGDDLTTREYSLKTKKVDIKVEYPVDGNPVIVEALRNYIKDAVNQNYTGSLTSPEDLIKSAVKALDRSDELDQEIKVVYNGPHSISVSDEGYFYPEGAAHGMPWSVGKSFLKSNGSTFEISMLPPLEKFLPQIANGLAQYLSVPVSDLKDELFVWDTPDFQYPSTVYLTDEGIKLIWGPYEIGPYSIGMPTVTIPATSANLQLLSPQALPFF